MDKDEKREAIIEKSMEIFARFGYKKTTMDDIANACHIGKATLYYYFKNKEDVFQSVMDKELEIFQQRITEAISKEETPQNKFRAYIMTKIIRIKEIIINYPTIKDEYLEQYAFIEQGRRNFTNFEIQTLKDILDEGIRKGIFKDTDTKTTAMVLVYAIKGLEYPWTVEQDIIDIEKAVELMLPVLFKGIER